jgi:deazaflavin-dependent oxidoreductase (nitroreductase family)
MPKRIPRWLARAPIGLFQHRLGWLFGGKFLMLEHTGRRSGQPRHVVLEVVDREPGSMFLVSGYGRTSEWLRNILVNPKVRVWVGRIYGASATATLVSTEATRDRLERNRRRNPRTAAAIGRILDLPDLTAMVPDDIADRLPLVHVRMDR